MTRTTRGPAAAVSLALAFLAFVGCNARQAGTTATPKKAPTVAIAAPPGRGPFRDWPKPVGALLFSGQMLGYLEPCGCSDPQYGGLARRGDLVEKLRARGWPVALLDLGSIADLPGARGGPLESKIKFGVSLRALAAMNYDAIALSVDDMKQGIDEAVGQYLNLGDKPKVVAANVVPAQGLEAAIRPSVRTEAGPFRVGVTAVLDPNTYKQLSDPSNELLTVNDPKQSLPAVLADLEKDTQVQVLMVQGPPEMGRELAEAFPGFELVMATSEVADPESEPTTLNDGKTLLIQVGKKGKYVGVVGLFDDPKQRFRYQKVNLDDKYDKAKPIQKLIDQDFQDELKQREVLENYTKHDHVGSPGATFLGAESCKTCHPNTFARWASTKHSLAYDALTKPERNRENDAECISCHTTGFEYTSGFRTLASTPSLKGNQCENCHGPGSKHAQEPDNLEYRKLLAQSVANPEQNRLCYRCHDEDNSPHFEFTKYYGQISHKQMDKYDNPEVHKPLKPKE